LVISHDIGTSDCMSLDSFFILYMKYSNPNLTLALNIKSDGLQERLISQLNTYNIENYFVFDMSVPDTIAYYKNGINFFSRQSELELKPVFYEKCKGVWLDSFESNWYSRELLSNHIESGKKVAIVSSELHNRSYYELWGFIKENNFHENEKIILCTDLPEQASQFFNIKS
jgi:hypothetical protein